MNIKLRQPCRHCQAPAGTDSHTENRGGQDVVLCGSCGKPAGYNAPKTETGRAVRTVTTVHNGVKPAQRSRIILRDGARCRLCGKSATQATLHVGHLLSVKDGMRLELSDEQINSDENLAAMCDECNLGLGEQTVPLWLMIVVLKARWENRGEGT